MVGTLSHLYATLQRLKKRRSPPRSARWYVEHVISGERAGPYEAAEVAYQLHAGLLGAHDWVINADSSERFLVAEHRFLKKWLSTSETQRHRLASWLKRAVRQRSVGQNLPQASLRRWLITTMDAEERRAFEVLSLEPGSPHDEVRQRHRELALVHHPDRGGSQERMKEINWAFDVASRVPEMSL
jgi:hypothetical protein